MARAGGTLKVLVLILVLANLVLFAWLRWTDDAAPPIKLEPVKQMGQRLVLSTDPDFVEPAIPEPATAASPVAATASRVLVRSVPQCLTWGPVSTTVAGQLVARFGADTPPMKQVAYTTHVVAAYRVLLADFPSAQTARQAATRIEQGGVQDLYLMPSSKDQPPDLSLGVFRQYDHAQYRADKVRALGYKPEIRALENQRQRHYLRMQLPVAQSVIAVVRAAGVSGGPFREECAVQSLSSRP